MGIFNRRDELPEGVYAGELFDQPIGVEQIRKADETLRRYKQDKSNLDSRLIQNEQWWKIRHLEGYKRTGSKTDPPAPSAWLWNNIVSKHAAAMDSYPEPNVRPRMPDDKEEAERLSDVIPVVLEHNDFQSVYSSYWWDKLIRGTGVLGVFWDASAINGMGDISVRSIDLLSLYWESGIEDIQASANVFQVQLVDNDILQNTYPQTRGKLKGGKKDVKRYLYDDTVDTTNKSVVVHWYYKRNDGQKTVLHYCKYVNDIVLFATENDPQYAEGWYTHGQYPFVFDPLYSVKGTPAGYGCVDISRHAQEQIDTLNQAIIKNAVLGSKPRFFVRTDANVNEAELANPEADIVHTRGNLGEDSIRAIPHDKLDGVYVQVLNNKIEELKETSGNRDVANGGTTGGITAASAVAALQEASGKLDRDANQQAYDAYRKVVLLVIELMRQFYALPRWFLIRGAKEEFIQFDNRGLQERPNGDSYRLPVFDIEVNAQRASPYTKMAQNELALQFLKLGFFNPGNERVALSCLEMMDFDHKDDVINMIERNDAIMQTAQMALILASKYEPALVPQMQAVLGMQSPAPPQGGDVSLPEVNAEGLPTNEPANVARARATAQESTRPR